MDMCLLAVLLRYLLIEDVSLIYSFDASFHCLTHMHRHTLNVKESNPEVNFSTVEYESLFSFCFAILLFWLLGIFTSAAFQIFALRFFFSFNHFDLFAVKREKICTEENKKKGVHRIYPFIYICSEKKYRKIWKIKEKSFFSLFFPTISILVCIYLLGVLVDETEFFFL